MNQKADPFQIPFGQFKSLKNSVFTKAGLLQKRNGYGFLPSLPDKSYTYLTTFNEDLTAIGPNLAAYSPESQQWIVKGSISPISLSVLPLIRNTLNQTQCDSAIAPNGSVCTVYTEINAAVSTYKYVIASSTTGQNLVEPTLIPVASGTVTGSPRVFLLGNYFVIVFTNIITSTSHLQYIAISANNPTVVTTNADIASAYISATTLSWDGVVFNNNLYVGYNTTAGGQAIQITYLSQSAASVGGSPATPVSFASSSYKATIMSLCVDSTGATPFIYASFYSSASTNGYAVAVDNNLNILMNPVEIIAGVSGVLNIASAAQKGVCSIFYEVSNTYSYDNTINTNYIQGLTITQLGTSFHSIFSSGASSITASSATGLVTGQYITDNTAPGNIPGNTTISVSGTTLSLSNNTAGNSASSPGDSLSVATLSSTITVARSLGLGSKAFIINGVVYFLGAYNSTFQNSYFLMNGSTSTQAAPIIVARLAWENGGGYLPAGLPSVSVVNSLVSIPYLYKDFIAPLSTANVSQQTLNPGSGIYSQTGIQLVTFNFQQNIQTAEIATNLNISGGFHGAYDGYLPVENNFFLYPENIEVSTDASAVTPTGTVTSGSNIVTAVSSIVGVGIGALITGTGIPANQVVTGVTSNTITFGPLTATGSHSAETITVTGNISTAQEYWYQVVYRWVDNQGNVQFSAGSIPVTQTTTGTTSTNTINIPTLRLTYKISNPVQIVIYRYSVQTEAYYQITSLTAPLLNSTTVDSVIWYDCQSDAEIEGNSIIYLNGGVAEDVSAPSFSVCTLWDTRFWIVDAEDPNTLWFSKTVIPATPVEMSDLLTYYVAPNTGTVSSTGPITAIAPLDTYLIIFKANALYWINGTGPDNTGAGSTYSLSPNFITATVGCADPSSIVITPDGLMFQSDKGVWLLNHSLQTSYIGAQVEDLSLDGVIQSAVAPPATNQIRQTLSTGQTLMYDYFFGQWGTFVGAPATSSCVYQNEHSYINQYGSVYQETPGQYMDGNNPVLMSFVTGWIQTVGIQGFQRLYYFYLLGQYFSPHKLQVQIAYNYVDTPVQQVIIQPTNFSSATPSPFGDQPAPFGSPTSLEQWKIHAKRQKCQSFQITVNEIFDPTYGTAAGAGLTLSGINMLCAVKRGSRPLRATQTAG